MCTYVFSLFSGLSFVSVLVLNIQKAKKKPLSKLSPDADLGVDISPRLKVLSVEEPPVREAGSIVEDVDELITKLKGAGVV